MNKQEKEYALEVWYDTRFDDARFEKARKISIEEPSEYAVDREQVNDILGHCIHSQEDYYLAIKMLNELPSVKPQKWIYVSEKMPKDGQYVLFCDIDDDIMIGYHVKGRPNTHFSQDGTWDDIKNVRAWMPLPKPYEPQESEE